MRIIQALFGLSLSILATSALADRTTQVLRKVEGYTVVAVTQVDGEFKGCDFGRPIKLQNGTVLKCSTYTYSYAYSPDAVIFAKVIDYQGRSIAMIKLLVESELHDMEPTPLR